MTGLPDHAAVIERFVAACQADDRIVAALLAGSYARDDADAYSDLDLTLFAAAGERDALWAERESLIARLGRPLFIEDFDGDVTAFFFLADGTEAELSYGSASEPQAVHEGPYRVLLDKAGVLDGLTFPRHRVSEEEQTETLRRQIFWIWHDLSHFIAAIGRGQRWWAAGQLEILRRYCVNLAHLRHDYGAPAEEYDKVDAALPSADLARLEATIGPFDEARMLDAAEVILAFYRDLAPPLAAAHGIAYPAELEQLMTARLEALRESLGA